MSPIQAALLGALQGATEFLPISSSAHLFAVPALLGWPYAGLAFDVALHWGTLIALLAAFWRDWWTLATDAISSQPARAQAARGLWLRIIVATLPAVAAGLLLEDAAATWLRSLPLLAAMLIVFGFLLWWVDRSRPMGSDTQAPGWTACLAMGCAQALALVPGVSRSGVTITAGRASGLSRVSAARFSFLLATPITMGAGLLELRHLPRDLPIELVAIGITSAALVGLLAIRGLLRWLSSAGFFVFFAYRTLFAALILWRLSSR